MPMLLLQVGKEPSVAICLSIDRRCSDTQIEALQEISTLESDVRPRIRRDFHIN